MSVFAIGGAKRRYDWGSTTAIQHLLGEAPDGRRLAELWFGAHPDDPSWVPAQGAALDALIGADARRLLGETSYHHFGPRLPYLLKLLAADRTLSMQAHPNLAQAREGYAREEAAGVSREAPERTYRDANHKPELLCAITTFDALCGFRPIGATLSALDELAVPELDFLAHLLRGPDPLRAAFTAVLTHPAPAALAAAVTAAAERAGRHDPMGRVLRLIAHDFPGDVGVVLALLLNHVRLAPGEAIFLGAGNVHCYLRGLAVEAMAASDNVLRCALTPKHVDLGELLRVTDFRELARPRVTFRDGAFDVPVPDFRLCAAQVSGEWQLPGGRPWIVLCVDGEVELAGLHLEGGRAAFAGADEASVSIRGRGRVAAVTMSAPG